MFLIWLDAVTVHQVSQHKQKTTSHFSHSRNSSSFIKSQFHCHINNSPPTECVMCQRNTIHLYPLLQIILNNVSPSTPSSPNQSLASINSTKEFSISPTRTTFPPYHNILDLVNTNQREQETLQHGPNN